jgi:FKBP-type peptidyl-prolyl cis-trans isomerase
MRPFMYLAGLVVLASACNNEPFRKGEKGLEYKIISDGKGDKLNNNEYMQIHVKQIYQAGKKDSILQDSRTGGRGPMIEMLDSASTPPQYYSILSQLRKGDSLVMRTLTDSVFVNGQTMPPMFKKGHYLMTTVKVVNVFHTKEQADSAHKAEAILAQKADSLRAVEQIKADDKKLQDYFKQNNIDASKLQKTTNGVYVDIIEPGTGNLIDTGVIVKTNYTGKTLDGKKLDSNTDPEFKHVEPFNVNLTSDMSLGYGVIQGWMEGMKLLRKGAKAKFYIPSPLAYGKQEPRPGLGENAILIFDIDILDIMTKEVGAAEIKAQQDRQMADQRRYIDSLKKLKAMDSLKKGK